MPAQRLGSNQRAARPSRRPAQPAGGTDCYSREGGLVSVMVCSASAWYSAPVLLYAVYEHYNTSLISSGYRYQHAVARTAIGLPLTLTRCVASREGGLVSVLVCSASAWYSVRVLLYAVYRHYYTSATTSGYRYQHAVARTAIELPLAVNAVLLAVGCCRLPAGKINQSNSQCR